MLQLLPSGTGSGMTGLYLQHKLQSISMQLDGEHTSTIVTPLLTCGVAVACCCINTRCRIHHRIRHTIRSNQGICPVLSDLGGNRCRYKQRSGSNCTSYSYVLECARHEKQSKTVPFTYHLLDGHIPIMGASRCEIGRAGKATPPVSETPHAFNASPTGYVVVAT